jgi:glycosyltransferase involved in cell wall biosynthesis
MMNELSKVDFVFNNTITNSNLLKELPLTGKKVFSYFHELASVTRFLTTQEEVEYLIKISEKIFVPTLAVKNFFTTEFQIPEEKIALLRYIIPTSKESNKEMEGKGINAQKERKNFLVGFCGTLESRKGCDLLPLLAKKIIKDKKVLDIHFIWIGANKKSLEYYLLLNDLQKLELLSYFSFIESTNEVELYLSQLDVLILASREEGFGLVVPEAAIYGVPTIYFSNAGGIVDFLGKEAGIAVDYLDIDAMAEKTIELKGNNELRMLIGKNAQKKIAEYSDTKRIVADLLKHFT